MNKEEMQTKGIKKADVVRITKRQEKLYNWYASKYIREGLSVKEQVQWDNACKTWDKYKVCLNEWSK